MRSVGLRNLQLPLKITNKLRGVVITDVTDQLPKNPKNTWAQLAGVRDLGDLTTIALHHDAYPKRNTANMSDMELLSDMAIDHIKNTAYDPTGEGGVPYHLWIRSGRIYQCNDLLDRTYGVGSNNGYTVHICVSGDYFQYDSLTDADRNALYAAILAVKEVLPNFQAIRAHKEFPQNNTSCPGYDVNRVRADIVSLEQQIKYAESQQNAQATAYKIANQILYLYNLAQGKNPDGSAANDGNVEWAKQMLLELEPFMQERSLL